MNLIDYVEDLEKNAKTDVYATSVNKVMQQKKFIRDDDELEGDEGILGITVFRRKEKKELKKKDDLDAILNNDEKFLKFLEKQRDDLDGLDYFTKQKFLEKEKNYYVKVNQDFQEVEDKMKKMNMVKTREERDQEEAASFFYFNRGFVNTNFFDDGNEESIISLYSSSLQDTEKEQEKKEKIINDLIFSEKVNVVKNNLELKDYLKDNFFFSLKDVFFLQFINLIKMLLSEGYNLNLMIYALNYLFNLKENFYHEDINSEEDLNAFVLSIKIANQLPNMKIKNVNKFVMNMVTYILYLEEVIFKSFFNSEVKKNRNDYLRKFLNSS